MEIFGNEYYIDLNELIKSCESEFEVIKENSELKETGTKGKSKPKPVFENQLDVFIVKIRRPSF